MSSALGNQLGLTEESTLEEIITAVGNVIDYSNTIQTALEGSSTDNSVSRYRINGNYIEVAPASGLWNNWDWGASCIKVPVSSVVNIGVVYQGGSHSYTAPSRGIIFVCGAGAASYGYSRCGVSITKNGSSVGVANSYSECLYLGWNAIPVNAGDTVSVSAWGVNGNYAAAGLSFVSV